jgi:hypothetical protein
MLLGGTGTAAAIQSASVLPAPGPAAVLPTQLQALEQKMDELKITSLRFSELTSVRAPRGGRQVLRLLKLLGVDSRMSGEVTVAPAAANVQLSLFGQPLSLREVGETVYLYSAKLGAADRGRPWLRLGPGGLGELVTVDGKSVKAPAGATQPKLAEPSLAEPPFAALQKMLAEARAVTDLGPGVIDGQPVARFLATLTPPQPLTARRGLLRTRARLTPATETLELAIAPDGLPVRTKIIVRDHDVTTTDTLQLAANFPLVIEPPPAAQTVTLAELRALSRHAKHEKGKRRKS